MYATSSVDGGSAVYNHDNCYIGMFDMTRESTQGEELTYSDTVSNEWVMPARYFQKKHIGCIILSTHKNTYSNQMKSYLFFIQILKK